MKQNKWKIYFSLIGIFILAFICAGLIFSNYFNQGIRYLNNFQFSIFNFQVKTPIAIPYIPETSFKLGLDLQGGSHLVYQADLQNIEKKERSEVMQGLRDIIEKRVNLFGVREPIVRVEEKGEYKRLVVELPGIKDTNKAIEMIGKTPYLEFREEREKQEVEEILEGLKKTKEQEDFNFEEFNLGEEFYFKPTNLTGKYLKSAKLDFDPNTFEPQVSLEFNNEGAKIFEELTSKNIDKRLAISIDGIIISAPVVRETISGGKAQITGKFTTEEAKELVRNFNAGALPVPISLIAQNVIGPTLGKISLEKSLTAAFYGFLGIILFMIMFYRLSGFFAGISLLIYGLILLFLFKFIPVTLTLAGIGGAILSVGMAVDANVLVFERQREELRDGESFSRAIEKGFSRAWPAVRDGNFTTLIIALIMFSFGTSFIKGFAICLSLGILTSLFSSLVVTKIFLKAFIGTRLERVKWIWNY